MCSLQTGLRFKYFSYISKLNPSNFVLSEFRDQLSHQMQYLSPARKREGTRSSNNDMNDGVHFIFDFTFFVRRRFKHFLAIADMIIARSLSPEKCDTVFDSLPH